MDIQKGIDAIIHLLHCCQQHDEMDQLEQRLFAICHYYEIHGIDIFVMFDEPANRIYIEDDVFVLYK